MQVRKVNMLCSQRELDSKKHSLVPTHQMRFTEIHTLSASGTKLTSTIHPSIWITDGKSAMLSIPTTRCPHQNVCWPIGHTIALASVQWCATPIFEASGSSVPLFILWAGLGRDFIRLGV